MQRGYVICYFVFTYTWNTFLRHAIYLLTEYILVIFSTKFIAIEYCVDYFTICNITEIKCKNEIYRKCIFFVKVVLFGAACERLVLYRKQNESPTVFTGLTQAVTLCWEKIYFFLFFFPSYVFLFSFFLFIYYFNKLCFVIKLK